MDYFAQEIKYFIAIISILNPIGSIPIFITITRPFSQSEVAKISTSCAVTVFVTLIISTFLGENILSVFGININSFRIGGGIVIAMTAFSMLRADSNTPYKITQDEIDRQSQVREIGIVPLAIPMLAGPGTITTAIIQSENIQGTKSIISTIVTLLLVALFTKGVLASSRAIRKKMGRVTMNVMTRVFGLILLAISIEHISTGIVQISKSMN